MDKYTRKAQSLISYVEKGANNSLGLVYDVEDGFRNVRERFEECLAFVEDAIRDNELPSEIKRLLKEVSSLNKIRQSMISDMLNQIESHRKTLDKLGRLLDKVEKL